MIQAGQTAALHNHGKALADLPIGIVGHFLLAPLDHVAALGNGLVQTAGADGHHITLTALAQTLQDLQHIAFADMILLHHGTVVNPQLISQLRHGHHDTVSTLGRTVTLIGACRRRIGVEHLQIVGHVIHGEQRQHLGAAIHGNGQAVVAEGSGIGAHFHEDRRDGTVLLTAHLHLHAHGVTGGVGIELLGAGIAVVNGLTGDPSGITGQILNKNILLAAVAAADAFLDDMDLIFRNVADPTDNTADMVRHLRGAVHHQTAVLNMGIADMGLQRRMLDLAGLIGALHDGIGLGKALFDVTDTTLVGSGNILMNIGAQRELIHDLAFALVTGQLVERRQIVGSAGIIDHFAVVDQRSALGHRLLHRIHGALRLILHLDERGGLVGDLRRAGNDAGNAVAHMTHLHVEQAAVMGRRLRVTLTGLHVMGFGGIVGRQNGSNAGQLLRFTGVNGLDISAGKGAAQHMQAPCVFGHLVLHEDGLAGNQCRTVHLAAGLADHFQMGTERRRNLALKFAEVTQLGRQLYRQIIMLITGITDEDTGQHFLDLLPGGMGLLFQQPGQDQRGSRRVISALYDAGGNHGLLHIVQLTAVQQGLGGFDLGALSLIEQDKVGILQLAVKNNGIRTGKALCVIAVADAVTAGLVQHITKSCGGLSAEDDLFAVDSTFQFHRRYLPSVKTIFARYFLYAALPLMSSTNVMVSARSAEVP